MSSRLFAPILVVTVGASCHALAQPPSEADRQERPAQLAAGQDHVADLLRQLDRASKAVPHPIWKLSRQCHDISFTATRKPCAEVRRLREALDMVAAEIDRRRAPMQPTAAQHAPVPLRPSHESGSSWPRFLVLLAVVLGVSLVSVLPFIWAFSGGFAPDSPHSVPPRGTDNDTHSMSRAVSNAPSQQTGPNVQPEQAPVRMDPTRRKRRQPPSWVEPYSLEEVIEAWMEERLVCAPAGQLPARAAFEDFCCWCAEEGLQPPSETAFGRALSDLIEHRGGRKVKRRRRAYYTGCRLR